MPHCIQSPSQCALLPHLPRLLRGTAWPSLAWRQGPPLYFRALPWCSVRSTVGSATGPQSVRRRCRCRGACAVQFVLWRLAVAGRQRVYLLSVHNYSKYLSDDACSGLIVAVGTTRYRRRAAPPHPPSPTAFAALLFVLFGLASTTQLTLSLPHPRRPLLSSPPPRPAGDSQPNRQPSNSLSLLPLFSLPASRTLCAPRPDLQFTDPAGLSSLLGPTIVSACDTA